MDNATQFEYKTFKSITMLIYYSECFPGGKIFGKLSAKIGNWYG